MLRGFHPRSLLMTADKPRAWLFHCHILTQVQNQGVEPRVMIAIVNVVEEPVFDVSAR